MQGEPLFCAELGNQVIPALLHVKSSLQIYVILPTNINLSTVDRFNGDSVQNLQVTVTQVCFNLGVVQVRILFKWLMNHNSEVLQPKFFKFIQIIFSY